MYRLCVSCTLTLQTGVIVSPNEMTNLLIFFFFVSEGYNNDQSVLQTHGTVMGLPMTVAIANLVLEDVQIRAFDTITCLYHAGKNMWMVFAKTG